MTISADVDELEKFAKALRAAGPKVSPKISGRLTANANAVARNARAAAPKDRPWLSTTEGIRVGTFKRLERTIYSPRDPEGQSVGYRVEYGTSVMAPRPFLGPALAAQRETFMREAWDVLTKAAL